MASSVGSLIGVSVCRCLVRSAECGELSDVDDKIILLQSVDYRISSIIKSITHTHSLPSVCTCTMYSTVRTILFIGGSTLVLRTRITPRMYLPTIIRKYLYPTTLPFA